MSTRSDSIFIDAAWSSETAGNLARNIILALAGSLLIALCARIQVPMYPVPMTMQTFAVLLIGLAFGWRLGAATVALYLVEGAAGLPVFASGGGLHHLIGPTGGYLIGFLPAAALVGWLAEQGWGRPAVRIFLAMLIGSAIIYLLGVTWLAQLVGFEKAITAGMMPFIVGDAAKAALAATVLPLAWQIISFFQER